MADKLNVSCIQMNMLLGEIEYNFAHVEELIENAVKRDKCDVIVLPETWNTGFFPKENLDDLCDNDASETVKLLSSLAKKYNINIVGGSVANKKDDGIYNTCCIFNRNGELIAQYDKTHLFTPMDEHKFFSFGKNLCVFELDAIKCGVIICYDLRFPELIRSLSLQGIELLFVVSQWPQVRVGQLDILIKARAVENQMYTVLCNSCAVAGDTVYGGFSQIVNPLGDVLAKAENKEEIINAELDFSTVENIRKSINVFNDRKAQLYIL